jgi:glutamine synthetase
MSKWLFADDGSGIQIHQNLWTRNKALFADGDGDMLTAHARPTVLPITNPKIAS